MNVWMLYIVICSVVLVLMGLGFALAVFIPGIDRWSRRFFTTFFGILFLNSCFSLVGILFIDVPGTALVQIITNFWLSLLTIVPLPMLTVFLLHCCGESWRNSPLFRAELALYSLYFILMIIAQFTSSLDYVTPDSHLHLGPLYPLLVVPLMVMALLNLVGLIRRRSRLTRKKFFAILIALLPYIM